MAIPTEMAANHGKTHRKIRLEKMILSFNIFLFGKHSPDVAEVSSGVLCYTAGAPPNSYSIFKARLPLAKRGDTAFSYRYYRVCRLATATPSN